MVVLLIDPSDNCAEVSRETFVINMLLSIFSLPTMTKQNKQRGQAHKNRTACVLTCHDYIPTRVTIAFFFCSCSGNDNVSY